MANQAHDGRHDSRNIQGDQHQWPLGPIDRDRYRSRVSAASAADQSLRDLFAPRYMGWGAVAIQVAGFVLILLLMRIDWSRLLPLLPSDATASPGSADR